MCVPDLLTYLHCQRKARIRDVQFTNRQRQTQRDRQRNDSPKLLSFYAQATHDKNLHLQRIEVRKKFQ